jgi:hypothetical protein
MPTVITATLLLAALLQVSLPAHAQWKWRDDLGRLHYSDQPPPPNVPSSRIMAIPGKATSAAMTGAAAPKANADASKANADASKANADASKASPGPKTWAERSMEIRKRDAQREAEGRKEEELARQAAALGQVCEGMRAEARTLESGMRLARVNAQGEQEIVSEEERTARLQSLRKDLQANCPTS